MAYLTRYDKLVVYPAAVVLSACIAWTRRVGKKP